MHLAVKSELTLRRVDSKGQARTRIVVVCLEEILVDSVLDEQNHIRGQVKTRVAGKLVAVLSVLESGHVNTSRTLYQLLNAESSHVRIELPLAAFNADHIARAVGELVQLGRSGNTAFINVSKPRLDNALGGKKGLSHPLVSEVV